MHQKLKVYLATTNINSFFVLNTNLFANNIFEHENQHVSIHNHDFQDATSDIPPPKVNYPQFHQQYKNLNIPCSHEYMINITTNIIACVDARCTTSVCSISLRKFLLQQKRFFCAIVSIQIKSSSKGTKRYSVA